ncbi:hypothetical protein Leryth_019460 [Lithospermum erythrorhizon]|nr:hypothetical protein Leryth_019460 [Lithospermum erythrorhizon]
MHNLQILNLQCNRLLTHCQIPSWICCNLEGNGKDMYHDEFVSSSVEMDIHESDMDETYARPRYGSSVTLSSHSSGLSSSSRLFAAKKLKGWKRRYYVQQRARQERLNNSRRNCENQAATQNSYKKCKVCKRAPYSNCALSEDSQGADSSEIIPDESFSLDVGCENSVISSTRKSGNSREDSCVDKCLCYKTDTPDKPIDDNDKSSQCDDSLDASSITAEVVDEGSAFEVSSMIPKAKRHFDGELDNPKPSKYRRPECSYLNLSCKYNKISFCGIDDHLVDGFYDAGRDRPFMELQSYENNLHLDSREVILVDRKTDESLDAIALRAQTMILGFKQMSDSAKRKGQPIIDDLQIASLLVLFVSDHFGGSDKTAAIQQTRKLASGSNYRKPFVCTCKSGNIDSVPDLQKCLGSVEDIMFRDLCERSLQSVKARRNSIVVPIGSLQFGVCRHRALLMKYLCDRMEPPIPCELVRGYLDFSPHAWNVVIVKRNQAWVRMIVDACYPHDIREEMDPEYFSRYIPLNRINVPLLDCDPGPSSSFPSVSLFEEIDKVASSTLMRCKFGELETAAKVRSLDVHGASVDEIRNFELNCLGEVRMLSLFKNPCIVELYGHQISSKWVPSQDAVGHRVLQATILMDYVKGGSLKRYLQELLKKGEKRITLHLALCIARDVACAMRELHRKHIIHRDIKSENIVIDLNTKRADGTPVVKLCDFDRAIPLRSYLHTCCIAHFGIPPPDSCVGTPRWMAPEVYLTMHNRNLYGLEVDIWSFGCLLLELLTLEIPYMGLSDPEISCSLQLGRRPPLTEELEELVQPDIELDTLVNVPSTEDETPEVEHQSLELLVNIYHRCTQKNPSDRPTAEELYDLFSQATTISTSGELEQE